MENIDRKDDCMSRSIVVKIMEKRLGEYGFRYEKYEACRWTFSREIEGIKQKVVIQKDIWGDSSYILEVYASALGRSLRVRELTNGKYTSDYFEFKNDDERVAVLNEIADIVIQYGIAELNKRNKPVKRYDPTDIMYQKLYEDQEILTQNYLKKCNISQLSEKDILPMLKKDFEECYDKTYEQAQEKLVELSAVYGNLIINRIGGQWRYDKIRKDTCLCSKPLYVYYPVLGLIVSYWQAKNAEEMIKNYMDTVLGYEEWVLQCKQVYGEKWEPTKE